jgi:hypothetical protein
MMYKFKYVHNLEERHEKINDSINSGCGGAEEERSRIKGKILCGGNSGGCAGDYDENEAVRHQH